MNVVVKLFTGIMSTGVGVLMSMVGRGQLMEGIDGVKDIYHERKNNKGGQ